MKLLLELPEFTSGFDEYGRSWPLGQQIARYDSVSGNNSGSCDRVSRVVPRDGAGVCLAGMTLMEISQGGQAACRPTGFQCGLRHRAETQSRRSFRDNCAVDLNQSGAIGSD
ncbi:hypothetical protein [Burkholderia sp. AW49-1]